MKLLKADTGGDLLRLETNSPMAAKTDDNNTNAISPEASRPRSRLVPAISEKGMNEIRAIRIRRNVIAPRNLPSTISVIETGEDNNNLIVPLRNSSLNKRIVTKGEMSKRTMPVICNNPTTTTSVKPRPAYHGPDSINFDNNK